MKSKGSKKRTIEMTLQMNFQRNCERIRTEKIKHQGEIYFLMFEGGLFFLGMLFFKNWLVSIILVGIGTFSLRAFQRLSIKYIYTRAEKEFKTFMHFLASNMSIGRSINHSVKAAVSALMGESKDVMMKEEFRKIVINLEMNMSLDEVFTDISLAYPVECILQFSKVVQMVVEQGGSVNEVIEQTVTMMEERQEVENELEVLITQKRYELIVLMLFVPLMILYLQSAFPEFGETMYHTLVGRCVMFLSLALYILSGFVGYKIIQIEV